MIPLWIYIRIRTILNVPGVSACVCLHEIVCAWCVCVYVCARAHAHVCAHACMPACNCVFLRVCVCLHAIVCASVAFLILNVAKSAAYSAIFFFCFQLPGYCFCPALPQEWLDIRFTIPGSRGSILFFSFFISVQILFYFSILKIQSHIKWTSSTCVRGDCLSLTPCPPLHCVGEGNLYTKIL